MALFVKICGLRDAESVHAAVSAGADAVGFVFAPGSRRLIGAQAARGLVERTPAPVETVGVFRNQPLDEVLRLADAAGVTTVQLHGDEPRQHSDRLVSEGFRTIRALSSDAFLRAARESPDEVAGHRLLIDAVNPGEGRTFDTRALAASPPDGFWLLAGGLTPANVVAAARQAGAHGVDVSSGVESAPGIKDANLIAAFVAAAKSAGTQRAG